MAFSSAADLLRFLTTVSAKNVPLAIRLRTYSSGRDLHRKVSLVDAIMATCASEPLSSSYLIDTEEFIGGRIGYANPCRELLKEAEDVFGSQALVSAIISLGTDVGYPQDDNTSLNDILSRVATDAEKTHQDLDHQMGHLGFYYRFSPALHTKPTRLAEMETRTQSYISSTRSIDECVRRLRLTTGILPLQQLSK